MTPSSKSATAAERRGLDLSSAPEDAQAMLNRLMWLEDENRRLTKALQYIDEQFCPGTERRTYNADITLVLDRIRGTARDALAPLGCPCVGTPDEEDCPHG